MVNFSLSFKMEAKNFKAHTLQAHLEIAQLKSLTAIRIPSVGTIGTILVHMGKENQLVCRTADSREINLANIIFNIGSLWGPRVEPYAFAWTGRSAVVSAQCQ